MKQKIPAAGEEQLGGGSSVKSDNAAQQSPAKKKPRLKAIKTFRRPNFRYKPITHHFVRCPVENESENGRNLQLEERKGREKNSLKERKS